MFRRQRFLLVWTPVARRQQRPLDQNSMRNGRTPGRDGRAAPHEGGGRCTTVYVLIPTCPSRSCTCDCRSGLLAPCPLFSGPAKRNTTRGARKAAVLSSKPRVFAVHIRRDRPRAHPSHLLRTQVLFRCNMFQRGMRWCSNST